MKTCVSLNLMSVYIFRKKKKKNSKIKCIIYNSKIRYSDTKGWAGELQN